MGEIRYHFVFSWFDDHTHTFSSQEKLNKMFEKYHQSSAGGQQLQIDAKCFALCFAFKE